jgi:hypothetical protein
MASYLDEFLNKPRNPQASGDIFSGLYNPEQIADLESQYTNEYGIKNTSGGIASDARHMAAMNNLSNSLSPMNNGIGNFIGDTGAFLAGGLNEIGALGRGFNKENFAEIGEDIAANFRGSFGTPNSTTAEDIYSQVFTGAVPQRVASSNNQAYGAAQASELTDLERDFPGMSTGDIIDSMNNRAFIGRQISPMAKPQIASPRTVIDPNRIPGRIQESVEPRQGILQGLQDKIGAGFNNVKDFAMDKGNMGRNLIGSAGAMAMGLPGIVGSGAMALMGGLKNQFQDRQLTGDIQDEYGNMYSADELNSQNALGGYYTDPARSARRRTSRIAKMRARDFNNKKISQTNLDRLVRQEKAQQLRDAKDAADRANIQNVQNYTGRELSGYRMSRPASERNYTGGSTNSNPSARGAQDSFSNKSGMGRTGYQEGGLASMFTRRR